RYAERYYEVMSSYVLVFFFILIYVFYFFFFFSSRRRHTRSKRDWSSDVCSSDLRVLGVRPQANVRFQNRGFALRRRVRDRELRRSEERRVGKECRSRWSPYH